MKILLPLFFALTQGRSLQKVLQEDEAPSISDSYNAGRVARTLVERESLMNVNTIRSDNVPVSFVEYYADCDKDGDPYWLVIDVSTTYRNIVEGSPVSFSIRVGDHSLVEKVDTEYPGAVQMSPAGSPRLSMTGHLQDVTQHPSIDVKRLEKCFLERHPDSRWWLPTRKGSPHSSRWIKITVDEIYFIGGFGDRAYIGPIDSGTYHAANDTL